MDKTFRGWLFLALTVLSGLGGLACILEWLGIKPGDLRMTATIPHALWLVVGLLLFAVSISVSFLAWRSSRNASAPERAEILRLKNSLYESARSNLEYRGDRDRCEDEKRVLQRQFDALLTPLQSDAVALAFELEKFSMEVHNRPDFALPKYQDSAAGTVARVEFLQRRNAIIESTYRQRFADRLKQIVDRLGTEGVKRPFLDSRVSGDIHEAIEAQTTANHLVGAAFELNGLYLYPPRTFTIFDLETMSGDEKARRIREEPGFAETTERYRMKNLIVRDK